MSASYDIVIVGGGPAGLSLACLTSDLGLRVAVVDRLGEEKLADPAPDGRDIALTHRSVRILGEIGVWSALAPADIAPIRSARVRNADQPQLLCFDTDRTGRDALGYLVGNQILRRALYRTAKLRESVELVAGETANRLELGGAFASIALSSGRVLEAPLLVAADSRFSELRRKAGIGADMRDFGQICIVCRLRHERPHDGTAYEWFDTGQTLAVLPLNGQTSSIVLTQPASTAAHTLAISAPAFAADIERRLSSRWGSMQLDGERHAYPLVAVYADRFCGRRVALVGDAAVGMHPVTAHGFNFGLRGAETLAHNIGSAVRTDADIGSASVLESYDREHRRATLPLYVATNAIVRLYTDSRVPARIARSGLLRIANSLSPIKDFMLRRLTDADGRHPPA
ncbi:MAG: 5-demethoxyubiquinol-8 5-hydroxylase UbiM [Hyphomicrobium sp.]